MSNDTYELLSLAARYWFTAVALRIVFRAWRLTVTDNRRAKILRDWAPETSRIGEVLIMSGEGGAKKGKRYPLMREAILGRSRNSDIHLSAKSIHKQHLYFEEREGGVLVRPMQAADLSSPGKGRLDHLLLHDGEQFIAGKVTMMLVLSEIKPRYRDDHYQDFEETQFHEVHRRTRPLNDDDEYQDFWEGDDEPRTRGKREVNADDVLPRKESPWQRNKKSTHRR